MQGDTRIFCLTHYYRVRTSWATITIPTGFLTDGASVPRCFWNVFYPFGPYFPAALLHDFLYSRASTAHFNMTRKDADNLFLEAMYNLGVGWASRHAIHSAVRAFGWRSYKKK
jgi:hypothetical protein